MTCPRPHSLLVREPGFAPGLSDSRAQAQSHHTGTEAQDRSGHAALACLLSGHTELFPSSRPSAEAEDILRPDASHANNRPSVGVSCNVAFSERCFLDSTLCPHQLNNDFHAILS